MFTSPQLKLRTDIPISEEEIIRDQIETDLVSEFKVNARNGVLYYRRKNTYIENLISERNTKNKKSSNKWICNHKCGSGFFKKIVDQKINYLLGKPVIINNADNCIKVFDINTIIKKASKEAAKKGVEWLHPYINADGEFKVINIDGLECIPIWDTELENELQQMIRYYQIAVVIDGEEKLRYKVELWDKEKVSYYMQDEEGNYYFDTSIDYNPYSHWNLNTVLGGNVIDSESYGWGKVPFVPIWNNDDKVNDLEAIKPDIDLYDVIKSDFGNNIDRFQEAILVTRNHAALSTEKFLELLKDYGIIELDDDGEVKWLQLEIPIEARKTFLEIIRDDIFEFGQAVDTRRVADGNTTNVVIKSRYADLDLKADDLEGETTTTIKETYWFANKYLEITGQKQDDLKKMEVVYNRNIIFNESETIDSVLKSKGITSDKTALSNHPWVDDVEEELLLTAEDEKKNLENMNNGEPFGQNNKPENIQNKEDEV
jgi:SPP1 family phage portal protein